MRGASPVFATTPAGPSSLLEPKFDFKALLSGRGASSVAEAGGMVNDLKDENDPTRLRPFARRIAEMNWWQNNPKSEEPADPEEETPAKAESEDQQPPADDEPTSESENS